MASTLRRSARTKKVQKYTSDPFETANIVDSSSDADEDDPANVDDHDDEDFQDQTDDERDINEDMDDSSDYQSSDTNPDASSTPVSRDNESRAIDPSAPRIPDDFDEQSPMLECYATSRKITDPTARHIRGIVDPRDIKCREDQMTFLVGTDTADMLSLVHTRDKWAQQPTFPTKVPNKNGVGGLAASFFHPDSVRDLEATRGWDWYYSEGGKSRFSVKQRSKHLTEDDAKTYLPSPTGESYSFLMGPTGNQKLFTIRIRDSMNLDDAWNPKSGNVEYSQSRRGWIVNVGKRVLSMGWAPNRPTGSQYLALAIPSLDYSTPSDWPAANEQEAKKAPAFRALAPTKASLQIWEFKTRDVDGMQECEKGRPLTEAKPQLRFVGCTKWGDLKMVSWCPTPRNDRSKQENKTSLGLLGTIWGDGKVRVLDVDLEKEWDNVTEYVRFNDACFEACAQNTLCTCMTWLSSTDIAVGCANGMVAIWNIQPDEDDDGCGLSESLGPRPWFYQVFHDTYILSIISAYPSKPHLLTTTAMDGHYRLTDIRAFDQDFVLGSRYRTATLAFAYSDHVQSVATADEANFIRLHSLRRFFMGRSVLGANANVLFIAAGYAHPCIMASASDGSVAVTNPLRRIMQPKQPQFQQIWFIHEWTPRGESGISRFSEGFKIEETKELLPKKGRRGIVFTSIYDLKTGVNQLSWNPNVNFGGWAAAAMGSGLLRVQDLAI